MSVYDEYNPLDYNNLTHNLVKELLSREPFELPLVHKFDGSGVYALFYHGSFPGYEKISDPDVKWPIYAGKAVPEGARKGRVSREKHRFELFKRIREHVKSIEQAENLELADFRVRFLVVTPLWITMAERFLIEHFQPVWNTCIEGFGNHNPGKGRFSGIISWWDALHPGREWAAKLRQTRSQEEAIDRLSAFVSNTWPD